ncbi:MAG: hypothetical protein K1X94_24750 [Sandaracinaceae bacterium]|nr:hypothetical protein [Sandaracinaceae bacterium]
MTARFHRLPVLVGIALALTAPACAARGPTVVVSVVTDLAPGKDFVGVRVTLGQAEEVLEDRERVATLGSSWIAPHQIAVFEDAPEGTLNVRASLIGLHGEVLIARETIDTHAGDRAINVILESSCFGVACPGDGEPATATECRGGRCVEPCADCPPQCVEAADCPPSAACGAPDCVLGSCIYPDGADRCPTGQLCHPSRGCVSTTVVVGCVVDDDCPDPVQSPWSSCTYADTCSESGERRREITSFQCLDNECSPTVTPETTTEGCARSTAGVACGGFCNEWSGCQFPDCLTAGENVQRCFTNHCSGGVCTEEVVYNRTPCTRGDQNGLPCGSPCEGLCDGTSCGHICEACGAGAVCGDFGCRGGSC